MSSVAPTRSTPPSRGERNPEETRQRLLAAAFREIHRHGFQGASLDAILAETGLTKGALYHHFANKQALGYAVVDEVLRTEIRERWLKPLEGTHDPVTVFRDTLNAAAASVTMEEIELGCPLNNLAQEMSPLDEGFRARLDAIYREWREGIAAALERGKRAGTVRGDADTRVAAAFILGAMEGCIGMAKSARSLDVLRECGAGLIRYLESLRNQ
jgi:AcrR family transcriptional regulator